MQEQERGRAILGLMQERVSSYYFFFLDCTIIEVLLALDSCCNFETVYIKLQYDTFPIYEAVQSFKIRTHLGCMLSTRNTFTH